VTARRASCSCDEETACEGGRGDPPTAESAPRGRDARPRGRICRPPSPAPLLPRSIRVQACNTDGGARRSRSGSSTMTATCSSRGRLLPSAAPPPRVFRDGLHGAARLPRCSARRVDLQASALLSSPGEHYRPTPQGGRVGVLHSSPPPPSSDLLPGARGRAADLLPRTL
jgi:hypothetical protein